MDPALERLVAEAATVLRGGGLVAYPTETFYALGAMARDAAAIARVAEAKGRPEGKPLPLIAADRAAVDEVASLGPAAERLASRFWPGPLTLVLPARAALPAPVTAGGATVAIRIPGSQIARALASAAGGAIVSTSANASGDPPPVSAGDLASALRARVDLVLDAGPAPGGLPSTIVEAVAGRLVLVRAGAVPFDEVLATVGAAG